MFQRKKNKEVLKLDLSGKSLHEVPKSVLDYPNLRELNLEDNQLRTLPEFLKELRFLEVINVKNNRLKTIPNFVTEFKNLKSLDVSENKISKLQLQVNYGELSGLESLNFGVNPLTEFPHWIWKLYNLKELYIYGLDLGVVPKEIGNLRDLEIISMDASKVTSLPEAFGYLRNLKELWAHENLLEQLPDTFGNLEQLRQVSFNENNLTSLPESIGNLRNLEELYLDDNNLTHLPESIGNLKKLDFIDIVGNELKDLPDSFYKFSTTDLEVFLDDNPFSKAAKQKIEKAFPESLESDVPSEKTSKQTKEEKIVNAEKVLENTVTGTTSPKSENVAGVIIGALLLVFLIPILIYFSSKKDPDTSPEILKNNYLIAKGELAQSIDRIFERTDKVFVYTNDTSNLTVKLEPNGAFKELNTRGYSSSAKAKYINDFLKEKKYGYRILLNNSKEDIRQMHTYDSVIPNDSVKKFRLTAYYKMTEKEREVNTKVEDLFARVEGKEVRKDTVFGVSSGIVDFKELKKGRKNNAIQSLFMPLNINLNREAYYFYFSPYNANVTKEEFLEAIAYFKKMYIKKGNPDKHCMLKTLELTRGY